MKKRRLRDLNKVNWNELSRTGTPLGLANHQRAANTNKGKSTNRQKPRRRKK